MSALAHPESEMPRRKGTPKQNSVKLTDAVHDSVRMAAGFTKESIAEFVNRVLLDISKETIDSKYSEWKSAQVEPKDSGGRDKSD